MLTVKNTPFVSWCSSPSRTLRVPPISEATVLFLERGRMATRVCLTHLSSCLCASIVGACFLGCPSAAFAQAPQNPQALQTEIDELKRDFDAVKQQYGDRLSALEAKLAS